MCRSSSGTPGVAQAVARSWRDRDEARRPALRRLDADRIPYKPFHMVPQEDLTGLRLVDEPRGFADEPSSDSARDPAPAPHDCLAGLESGAKRGIELPELERSASGPQRIVFVHDGDAEDR